jgi:hypothetical protein
MVDPNDPEALAQLLVWSWQNLDALKAMGMNAVKVARELTHWKMHELRWKLLLDNLEPGGQPFHPPEICHRVEYLVYSEDNTKISEKESDPKQAR